MAQCIQCGKKGAFLKLSPNGRCVVCEMQFNADRDNAIVQLTQELATLKVQLLPEHNTVAVLQQEIFLLEQVKQQRLSEQSHLIAAIEDLHRSSSNIQNEILELRKKLIETEDEILFQEFGLYDPTYDFCNADNYKTELANVRQRQKDSIKNDHAVTGNMSWTVNGNAAQGKKMVKDMQKLLLRAFNSECDEIVEKVKYNNYEVALKRMAGSRDAISKLGKIMDVALTTSYYDLKVEELTLALEYRQQKQKEKEAQQEIRAQMREEAKLQREIEESRKKAEKEKNHYENARTKLIKQLESAAEADRAELESKIALVEAQLDDVEKAIVDIDYREANQRAGYVYIVSNIGSFGPDVYKIGMTRRLDPTERIDELGDASVPFNFDIHAMIFSEDAPGLETALHHAFEKRKLNMVNSRREFFRVTLEEIKQEVKKNFDKTAEFIDLPDAEQFRISEKLRAQ